MAEPNCFTSFGFDEEEQAALFGTIDPADPRLAQRVDAKIQEAQHRVRSVKLQAVAIDRVLRYIDATPGREAESLTSILVRSVKDRGGVVPIEQRAEAIVGEAHSQLWELIEHHRPKYLGFSRDKQGMRNIVRELFGEATGDADAALYAKSWAQVAENSRARFNKAGGAIRNLDTWALPQSHSITKVGKASFDDWAAFIAPRLDRARMVDQFGDPLDAGKFKALLLTVYDSIRTDGLSKLDPGVIPPGVSSKLANRHRESRVLHFKDGNGWLEYQDKFGSPDSFDSMMGHLDQISRETALMETLGPDPDRVFQYLRETVQKKTGKPRGGAIAQVTYDELAGKLSGDSTWAGRSGGVRALEIAVDLGSATLSAISDPVFQALTARFNGLSSWRAMTRMFNTLVFTRKADQQFMAQTGLVAEHALDRASSANRFAERQGHGIASRISDITMRLSGLNAWTQAGRRSFEMEFLAGLHRWSADFAKLPPKSKRALARYGITAEDWTRIKAAEPKKLRGARFIDPSKMGDTELQAKVVGMIKAERDLAIPEPDARIRGVLKGGTEAGTVAGEIIRHATLYKSFPVTAMTGHLMRGFYVKGGFNKAAYLTTLFTATTALGAVSMQAKQVARGKELRTDIDKPEFWMQAAAQGGGAGILGDFLLADQNRFGQSLAATLAGPTVGRIEAVGNMLFGTAQQQLGLYGGKPADIEGRLAAMAKGGLANIPGSKLWYTRLALERLLFDQVNKATDPKWSKRQKTRERRMRKETGQRYWWKPGKTGPGSSPMPRF